MLKVYLVISLPNILDQSLQVLKWFACLMFIPVSQLLLSWELSIVNFTGFWGFVVVRISLSLRWSVLLSFWKLKAAPLKILSKRARGLPNKEILFFLEFQHLEYSEWFCIKSCKWGASCKPTWSLFLWVLFILLFFFFWLSPCVFVCC